jgi:dienelactone hydrolase
LGKNTVDDLVETALTYVSESASYHPLVVHRQGDRPKALVVLLPDWQGQSPLARDHAGALATHGFAVAIVDLYGNGWSPTDPEEVGPLVQRLIADRAIGVASLTACVAELRRHWDAPVVCLGYSVGGMIALDYARNGPDIAGVVVCSALLKTAVEGTSTTINAPLLVLQGTQDQVSPVATIAELIDEMDAAGNDVRFELYSQTHHAFDNPDAGDDLTSRLVYSPNSAQRAHAAIARFIAEVSDAK